MCIRVSTCCFCLDVEEGAAFAAKLSIAAAMTAAAATAYYAVEGEQLNANNSNLGKLAR